MFRLLGETSCFHLQNNWIVSSDSVNDIGLHRVRRRVSNVASLWELCLPKTSFFPRVTTGNYWNEVGGDCGLVCACFWGALSVFSAWMGNQWHWGYRREYFLPYGGQNFMLLESVCFLYWKNSLRLSYIIVTVLPPIHFRIHVNQLSPWRRRQNVPPNHWKI
jgi:hypothetical protein